MTELEQNDGNSNSDKIYFRKLRTVLRGPGKQERNAEITVHVEVQQAVGALFRQALLIRLTDDNDLFFLLTLKIVEEDFQILKSQQGLLVDFAAFPQKFVNLLEQCRLEESKDTPRFLLCLAVSSSSPAVLDIVETNPFKHLVHLSLHFSAGSDSDVKSYLAGCNKSLKLQKERLECQLKTTETDLRVNQERFAAAKYELDKIRKESSDQVERLQSRLLQEMSIEKEQSLKASSELQYRHEKESRETEYNHKRIVAQLECRIATLESQNKELQELRSQLEVCTVELRTEKQQNSRLRQDNSALDAKARESETAYSQLKTQAALAEQELRTKEQTALKQQNVVDRLQEQKQRLEEENQQRQQIIVKREAAVKTLSEELQKANEIIRKLQMEVRSQQAKLKVRNRITSEQEKVIAEKDEEIGRLSKEVAARLEEGRSKDVEMATIKRDLEASKLNLEESERVIKTNENVINWLNKQLNQAETSRKDAMAAAAVAPRPFDYTSGIPRSNFQNTSPILGSITAQVGAAAGAVPRPPKTTQVRYSPNAVQWVPHKPPPIRTENTGDGKVPVSTGLDPMYLQPAPRRSSQSPIITASAANTRAPPTGSTAEGPRLPRALISPVTPPTATTPSSYFPAGNS